MKMRRTAPIVAALALCWVTSASAAWHQPIGGDSPINVLSTESGDGVSMAVVGGVPLVAWSEFGGGALQIRVARLNAAGTAWEAVGGSLNQDPARNAFAPSIADVGGVPHVAWFEKNASNIQQVRVARLNAAGDGWEKVGQVLNPASPLNFNAGSEAAGVDITSVNGVPFVAWQELDGNWEVRVARLNSAGTGWDRLGTPPTSPVNRDGTLDGTRPSIDSIGGVPWITWRENDGTNVEIRAARYNASTDHWDLTPNTLSPINVSSTRSGADPQLANIGGVPHIAWREDDGTNSEVRVSRLNAAGTAWEQIADSASPINESPGQSATDVSLSSIGGAPWVAWIETDGTNNEVRVARLNAAGTAWEKVAGSASPINESASRDAFEITLAVVGDVPYVAWDEADPAALSQVRVSRLEPEFVSQSVDPGATTATLSAQWHTYGVGFPIGFDYGASLESSTVATPAPAGVDSPVISQQVTGLSPTSAYQFRSFATAGVPQPRLLAPSSTVFNTTAAPDTTPPQTTITKEPKAKSSKAKAKYKFSSNEPGSTFVCKFDKAKPKPCDAGKFKAKRLDDGKHKFSVYAVDAAGNQDQSPAKDKFKVL